MVVPTQIEILGAKVDSPSKQAESKTNQKEPATPSSKARREGNTFSAKKISVADLGIRPYTMKELFEESPSIEQRNSSANHLTDWTDPGTYLKSSNPNLSAQTDEEYLFQQELWTQIDNSIYDDPYLSEYGHTGKVYFKFSLTASGDLDQSSLDARAEDGVLKVLAARAIRKALSAENIDRPKLIKTNTEKSTSLVFNAQFSWASYQDCKLLQGAFSNRLSFCKYAEDKRKSFSAAERTGQYLKALTKGFGAAEEIEKYNREEMHKKTQFDPFDNYRRDPDYNLGNS